MKKITCKGWSLSIFAWLWIVSPMTVASQQFEDVILGTAVDRVSIDGSGVEGNGKSSDADLSPDGRYVVFASKASNLVSGDTNGLQDIFLRDTQLDTIERISVDSAELQATAESFAPVVSADGRYVAFQSLANNLVAGDTNNQIDVFVRDRSAGTTIRVSVDSQGVQGDGESTSPAISSDGNLVVFQSYAANLVTGDTNAMSDIFLHNQSNGETKRVSVNSQGLQSNGQSFEPKISGDGLFIAFSSKASNLVSQDLNDCADVFVRDVTTATTFSVSINVSGDNGNRASGGPSISYDGKSVAFQSRATNLVTSDTNGYQDVFVRHWGANVTEMVSLDHAGNQIPLSSQGASISGSGRFISFVSKSPNVVSSDSNGSLDVFIRDRGVQATILVSSDVAGVIGNGDSSYAKISGNGAYFAIQSKATNLVASDTNGVSDIFLKENEVALSTISVGVASSVNELGAPSVVFTFVRDFDSSLALPINVSASLSEATEGSDFVALPPTVSFAAGSSTATLSVQVIDDTVVEASESIVVSVLPGPDYVVVPPASLAATRIVSDEKPSVNIKTSKVFYEVGGERLTTGYLYATRDSDDLSGKIVVPYLLQGTVTAGADYVSPLTELVIPDGEKSARIPILSKDDELDEGIEFLEFVITEDIDYKPGDTRWNKLFLIDNDQDRVSVASTNYLCEAAKTLYTSGGLSKVEFEYYFGCSVEEKKQTIDGGRR